MTSTPHADGKAWLIPPDALAEWLTLAAGSWTPWAQSRAGPNRDLWWPAPAELDSPAAHGAVTACGGCGARLACAAYAVAAHERHGVWGGLLPEQRQAMRRQAA